MAEAAGFMSNLIFVMYEFYFTALRICCADSSPTPFDLRLRVLNLNFEAISFDSTSRDSCVSPHFYKSSSLSIFCPCRLMSASHKNLAHRISMKLLSPRMSECKQVFYLRPRAKLYMALVEIPHLFILSVWSEVFFFRNWVRLSKCSW